MEIIVRNETQKDYRRVEEITREAFAYPDRIERGGIGCPYEHWMVHELRKRDGILELSLVATVNDEIVGGVGKALINELIIKAKDLGYGAILFFGRPEYYPQFGFIEAREFSISDSEGYNYDSFMGMELIPGYLSVAKGGRFYESDIYNDDLNRETVKEFDAEFIM